MFATLRCLFIGLEDMQFAERNSRLVFRLSLRGDGAERPGDRARSPLEPSRRLFDCVGPSELSRDPTSWLVISYLSFSAPTNDAVCDLLSRRRRRSIDRPAGSCQ